MMTSNEVLLHQKEQGSTALALVSQINLVKGGKPDCNGGKLEVIPRLGKLMNGHLVNIVSREKVNLAV